MPYDPNKILEVFTSGSKEPFEVKKPPQPTDEQVREELALRERLDNAAAERRKPILKFLST